MMGRAVGLDYRNRQGDQCAHAASVRTALAACESPCILCGSCFDACPLGLHPVGMVNRIRERRSSRALEHQW
jgi:ferredoxin